MCVFMFEYVIHFHMCTRPNPALCAGIEIRLITALPATHIFFSTKFPFGGKTFAEKSIQLT